LGRSCHASPVIPNHLGAPCPFLEPDRRLHSSRLHDGVVSLELDIRWRFWRLASIRFGLLSSFFTRVLDWVVQSVGRLSLVNIPPLA
jgi:hypothetical protein